MPAEREVLNVPEAPAPNGIPASSAVRADDFVFVGATSASDGHSGLADASRPHPGLPLSGVNPRRLEARVVYERLQACLEAGGSSLDRAVQVNQWVPTFHGAGARPASENRNAQLEHFYHWREAFEPYLRTRDEYIEVDRPASVAMPVDRVLATDDRVSVEMVGVTAASGIEKRSYEHEVHVPAGGYSIGIEAGPLLFTAGFIASDFEHGRHPDATINEWVWYGNQVASEVDNTLTQLRTSLEAGDARFEDTVKAILYVTPEAMRNLPVIEEVWRKHWPEDPPARAVVPVAGVGMRPLAIEIVLIIARREHGGDREVISTDRALPALGHAPQAIRSGPLLFVSGQLGRTREGAPAGHAAGDRAYPYLRRAVKEQVTLIQENAHAICGAAGTSFDRAVKANLFFTDFNELDAGLTAWGSGFGAGYPASGFFEVPLGLEEVPGCRVSADLTFAV
jgi:2-iminobutanoate/2-iminopropanoate deaminase